MDLMGKTAVVTGAARGIGKGIALTFARDKADVVICDVNGEAARETAEELEKQFGTRVTWQAMNVADEASVKNAFDRIFEQSGSVDILVNNAGICRPKKPFEEIEQAEWDAIFSVNLMGAVNCSKAVIPGMKQRQYGRIISMASMSGEQGGISVSAVYSVSKAAIICLTKNLAKYLGPYGITANALAPGLIATDMIADLSYDIKTVPLGRYGQPADVAEVVRFLASDEAGYITGSTIDVNGGLYMK